MGKGWTDADRDTARARLAALAADLPGAEVEDAYGHTAFRLRGTAFAWLQVDHHGDGRLALCCKAPPGEQQALVSAEPHCYFVPAYLGVHGWVGANLDPASAPDWNEVAVLIEQAWRLSATKRAIAAFDALGPSRVEG